LRERHRVQTVPRINCRPCEIAGESTFRCDGDSGSPRRLSWPASTASRDEPISPRRSSQLGTAWRSAWNVRSRFRIEEARYSTRRRTPGIILKWIVGRFTSRHLSTSLHSTGDPEADRILIKSVGDDGQFEFIGTANQRGFLGKLTSRPIQASSRFHAEEIAFRALAPSLSEFSLQLDIPLEIAQIETKDLFTENHHVTFTVPFPNVPMAVAPLSKTQPDFRGVASLYCEALNANSPVYQFLCLFKIIEALRARRKKLQRDAKRGGVGYTSPPTEELPTSYGEIRAWLDALFYVRPPWDLTVLDSAVPPEVRGKPFDEVITEMLNPLRVNVAHALFEDTGPELTISCDDLLDTRKIAKLVPLTKCIVRRMLKTDFPAEFLGHLPG